MSHAQLEALLPALEAIPPEAVRRLDVPVSLLLQEAHELADLVAQPDVAARLVAVGVASADLEALDTIIDATRTAQARWVTARDRGKSEATRDLESFACALRAELIDACRWSLRDDRVAMNTLRAVQQCEDLPGLVLDLRDLGHLLESRRAAFEPDTTFDPRAQADRARTMAAQVADTFHTDRLDPTQLRARSLRDRTYTYLDRVLSDIREAGRYAFRNEPRLRQRFVSERPLDRRHTHLHTEMAASS